MNDKQIDVSILLIEDDEEDALILRQYGQRMTEYNMDLTWVTSIRDAEVELSSYSPDMIFCDLNLGAAPGGMDFLHRLQEMERSIPVVVYTGSGNERKAVEAMKCGAYDYICKSTMSAGLLSTTIRTVSERVRLERERDEMLAKLERMTVTDALTGLANRRRLGECVKEECRRSTRSGRPFALLMLDLDHFKQVNDNHGHQTGDAVLRTCAGVIQGHVRTIDVAARYGGEEFCVLLPDTAAHGGSGVAERIRESIAALGGRVPTVSIGLALWQPDAKPDDLFTWADRALYQAKEAGRNCVVPYMSSVCEASNAPTLMGGSA
jgi:diguanylate cyclase (GGDEF)-like protein